MISDKTVRIYLKQVVEELAHRQVVRLIKEAIGLL